MKKFLITVGIVMTVFTIITACAIGTWSAWYPWPPPEHDMNDIQTAIIVTWFWAVLVPTAIVDLCIYAYSNEKGWWK